MATKDCRACKAAAKYYPEADYILCEDNMELSLKYHVTSAPTIVLLQDGEPVDSWIGFSASIANSIDERMK